MMPLTQSEFSSLKKSRPMDREIHDVLTKAEKAGARFALLHADDEFCQHHLFGMLSFFSGC